MKRRWLLALILAGFAAGLGDVRGLLSAPVKVQIPCRDPRGCPDLVVDAAKLGQWHVDAIDFSPTDCAVVEGCVPAAGKRLVLRFTSNTPNIGLGDLIIGDPTAPENQGFFRLSECHRHLHFQEYADYRLWTPAGYQQWQALRAQRPGALARDLLGAHPEIAAQRVAGRKQGFCVIDLLPANIPGPYGLRPGVPKYTSCSSNQGLSTGYADEYTFGLDCQWIDVTNVAPGRYILEDEVNAEHLFAESSYRNNASAIEISVPDRTGRAARPSGVSRVAQVLDGGAKCKEGEQRQSL
jgi:hypothetical protein